MRWNKYSEGDIRTVKRFLFFPLTINGKTRWLEWTTIKQQYYCGYWDAEPYSMWVNMEFVDSLEVQNES
jgi:hypothetical protein